MTPAFRRRTAPAGAFPARRKTSPAISELSRRSPTSLYDLVGAGEDRGRHGQAERLGGLEIDHQLENGRLLDRQVGGLRAREDLSDVTADFAIVNHEAHSIADQATGGGELAHP